MEPDATRRTAGRSAFSCGGDTVLRRSLSIDWALRANAVWRFGRVFLRCPKCDRLATRIYVPRADAWPACRRCWGLTYESRRANYNVTGPFSMLGSFAEAETVLARARRAQASAERYAERRAILK